MSSSGRVDHDIERVGPAEGAVDRFEVSACPQILGQTTRVGGADFYTGGADKGDRQHNQTHEQDRSALPFIELDQTRGEASEGACTHILG